MNLIFRIALKNLLRQKSRSIFLGIGISFGMMILVISHSFSEGLSDIILNRLIVDMVGHVGIVNREKIGKSTSMVIRDKHEMTDLIKDTLTDIRAIRESVGTNMIKTIGNNASTFTILVGLPDDIDSFTLLQNLDVVEGNMDDFRNKKIKNPLILFSHMAEQLNVKLGDTVKVIMGTIYGQVQSARLQLVAIVESQNPFMDASSVIPLDDAKELMGYRSYETQMISVVLNNVTDPEITLDIANKLQKALEPKPISIYGTFKSKDHVATEGTLLALQTNPEFADLITKELNPIKGSLETFTGKNSTIIIGKSLAEKMQAEVGEAITFTYETRFEGISPSGKYDVVAIISGDNGKYDNTAFLTDLDIYDFCYVNLPKKISEFPKAYIPTKSSTIYHALALSHTLFPRTETFRDLEKKMREIRKVKFKGQMIDVFAMQEVADLALTLESTLNLISLITVLILFFILIIGIVNTLRMTIKERTREIGTIRAIGMQKKQVNLSFIMETVFLSLFASIGGIILAFGAMYIISHLTFKPENVFSIFLNQGHVHFLPKAAAISLDLFLILFITIVTAYFPAKRAAELVVADALRHYE